MKILSIEETEKVRTLKFLFLSTGFKEQKTIFKILNLRDISILRLSSNIDESPLKISTAKTDAFLKCQESPGF
jgi:hypothetical protein